MLNITPFGWFHTAISLVSLFGGLYALLRYHDIRYATTLGKTYTWFTVATCITSFFLMRTGKLSDAHGLTVLTLIVLAVAVMLGRKAIRPIPKQADVIHWADALGTGTLVWRTEQRNLRLQNKAPEPKDPS